MPVLLLVDSRGIDQHLHPRCNLLAGTDWHIADHNILRVLPHFRQHAALLYDAPRQQRQICHDALHS